MHRARTLRQAIGSRACATICSPRTSGAAPSGDDLSPSAKGIRRLRTVALGLIAAADEPEAASLAKAQFDAADNMTDRQGALGVLVSLEAPERQAALDAFYERFQRRCAGARQMVRAAGRGAAAATRSTRC